MHWWILGAVLTFIVFGFLWRAYTHPTHTLGRQTAKWLATSGKPSTENEEIGYYEAINKYIASMGFYETLLELQGTDEEYCIASMKMHKAGYLTGQSEKVVGALTMDSAKQYQQNRELAILFLKNVEKQFLGKAG
jgi:hypothetical protein